MEVTCSDVTIPLLHFWKIVPYLVCSVIGRPAVMMKWWQLMMIPDITWYEYIYRYDIVLIPVPGAFSFEGREVLRKYWLFYWWSTLFALFCYWWYHYSLTFIDDILLLISVVDDVEVGGSDDEIDWYCHSSLILFDIVTGKLEVMRCWWYSCWYWKITDEEWWWCCCCCWWDVVLIQFISGYSSVVIVDDWSIRCYRWYWVVMILMILIHWYLLCFSLLLRGKMLMILCLMHFILLWALIITK